MKEEKIMKKAGVIKSLFPGIGIAKISLEQKIANSDMVKIKVFEETLEHVRQLIVDSEDRAKRNVNVASAVIKKEITDEID